MTVPSPTLRTVREVPPFSGMYTAPPTTVGANGREHVACQRTVPVPRAMPNTSPAVLTATRVDPLASATGASHAAGVLDGAQRQRSAPVRVSSATRSCAANTAVVPTTSGGTVRSRVPASVTDGGWAAHRSSPKSTLTACGWPPATKNSAPSPSPTGPGLLWLTVIGPNAGVPSAALNADTVAAPAASSAETTTFPPAAAIALTDVTMGDFHPASGAPSASRSATIAGPSAK